MSKLNIAIAQRKKPRENAIKSATTQIIKTANAVKRSNSKAKSNK